MIDKKTIDVYNAKVDDYRQMAHTLEESTALELFMAELPAAGLVLDLGCGPGTSSALLHRRGYRIDPMDASDAMVRVANAHFNVGARVAGFDSINASAPAHYEGVWANFSLLHATKGEFPGLLQAVFNVLKPGGVFHLGMKTGTGARRDSLGRFYTFYTRTELECALADSGFHFLSGREGEDKGLAGTLDPWVTLLSRKPENGEFVDSY